MAHDLTDQLAAPASIHHETVRGRSGSRALVALFTASVVALASGTADAAPLKIACVGEHTTHSNLYPNTDRENQPPGMQEYPVFLQQLLGTGYDVRNFGDCCASVVQGYPSSETHPYVSGGNFKNSVAFAPDIVVIGSWGRHDWGLSAMTAFTVFSVAKFQTDYEDMVQRYLNLPNHPKVYASLPIPILFGEDGPDRGFKTSPIVEVIKAVAAKHNLPTIDLYSAFLHHKELYINPPDKDSEGEHTNEAGMRVIAQLVHDSLLENEPAVTDGGSAGPLRDATARDATTRDATARDAGTGSNGSTEAGRAGAGGSTGVPPSGSVGAVGTAGEGGSGAGSAGVAGAISGGASGSTGSASGGAGSSSGASGAGGVGVAGGEAGASAGAPPMGADPDNGNGCACRVGMLSIQRTGPGGGLALLGIAMLLLRGGSRRRRT